MPNSSRFGNMFKSNMDLTDDEVHQHAEADRRESIRRSKWSKWSPPAELLSQTKRRRRIGLLGWLWRIGVGLLILVVGLAGAGLIFQAVATRNDQQEFPPPGELVDIDGYELHIDCIGEGKSNDHIGRIGQRLVGQLGPGATGDSAVDSCAPRLRPGWRRQERSWADTRVM